MRTFDTVLDVHNTINTGAHGLKRIASVVLDSLTDVTDLTLQLVGRFNDRDRLIRLRVDGQLLLVCVNTAQCVSLDAPEP